MNRGSRFPRLDRERFAAGKPAARLSPHCVPSGWVGEVFTTDDTDDTDQKSLIYAFQISCLSFPSVKSVVKFLCLPLRRFAESAFRCMPGGRLQRMVGLS
jgi:hypothetical protein